ncbi:helix-turn-helix domain-containing protein [uncultured Roseibium sp.]|uniref:helix-turn-helix domain-containing protein n=1 Tax=uncultured Roseibium sp. TaxID=1936171 RepID=UPI00344E4B5C
MSHCPALGMSRSYSHLHCNERRAISTMLDQKFSQSETGKHLGRDRATLTVWIRCSSWRSRKLAAIAR